MKNSEIVQKVWNYSNILQDTGVAYTEYVRQITYLLFLKMDYEKTVSLNEESLVEENCRWNTLLDKSGEALEKQYSDILNTLSAKKEGVIGKIFLRARNEITQPALLKQLIALINKETWLALDMDIKGAIYEGILQKNAEESKSGAGQYFTPRPVINAIVQVMRPSPEMSVTDPACGTGGFLLAAYDFMKKQTQDKETLKKLRTEKLSGNDIAPLVVNLCAMNLYLHGIGDGKCLVSEKDSLMSAGEKRYDMCMTNPPFGTKSSNKIMGEDGKAKTEKFNYER